MFHGKVISYALAAMAAAAVLAGAADLMGQEDVSSGGRIESDIYMHSESPPEALLDGDDTTHYCHHRLEDADWRMWLSSPASLSRVTFVQGWPDWEQPTRVRLESADGTQIFVDLAAGTREPQSFDISFPNPTAFVDVYVAEVQDDGDDEHWGGFATMTFLGTPVPSDGRPPSVENVAVNKLGDASAEVTWTTDEPATGQVVYSTTSTVRASTPPSLGPVTDHLVRLDGDAPLMGNIEIRSADAEGNRAEVRVDAFNTLDTAYSYGVGGWSFNIDDAWVPAPELFARDGMELGFVQQWVGNTRGAEWFRSDDIRAIGDGGYIPDVIHYYFGDPTIEKIESMREGYIEDIRYLADLIAASGVGDRVIVTLEPEFNQDGVPQWDGWNDLMIQTIDILHSVAGCKVGVLAGDWDIDHYLPVSMGRAAAKSDFVAFQEMRASTRDQPEDAYDVVDRAIRFGHYMARKFMRPVRWGYVMVSDYGYWTEVQRRVVVEICERQPELEGAGVTAVSWMSYIDSPAEGGYFDVAESHKGLKYSDNTPKPAWYIWRECLSNGPTWLDTGQWPPGGEPVVDLPPACGCSLVR
jgi:hypothetical protein